MGIIKDFECRTKQYNQECLRRLRLTAAVVVLSAVITVVILIFLPGIYYSSTIG